MTSYERAPGWVWRVSRSQVLLVGPDGQASRVGGAAASAWVFLETPGTATDILARLGDPSGLVDEADAIDGTTVMLEALDALAKAGLVVVA